ncbi:MAG: NYN domain-containing protein [Candidatus Njordarchaeales archaeon]
MDDKTNERDTEEVEVSSHSFLDIIQRRLSGYMKKLFRHSKKEVGIIIDGPNLLRKINGKRVSLKEIRRQAEKLGRISVAVAFLSPDAPASLIKALSNSGFEPRVVPIGDIHVAMAVETMRLLKEEAIDVIIIGSRDSRCLPILQKIKSEGAIAAVMGFEPGFSVSLKNAADEIIELKLKEVKNLD